MLNFLSGRRDAVEDAVAKGHYPKAIRELEKRLADEPSSVYLRQRLAEVLELDDQVDRAVLLLLELVDELAEGGFVARSLALLKKVRRMAPQTPVDDRLAVLKERGGSEPASDDQDSAAFTTSEIVLTDWVEEAESRDDFHWSPLLSELSEQELESVFGELRLLVKHPGAIIYAAGEQGGGLYVLASGSARVYQPDEQGRFHQIRMLYGGDFFGIDSVLRRGPRRFTVTAAEPCELLEMDPALFERLATLHPQIREQVERMAQKMDAFS